MKHPISALAVLLATLSAAFEAEGTVASNWMEIESILLGWDVKRVNLQMSGGVPNPLGCGSYVNQAQADENLANIDHVLSLSMAAFVARKEVQLVIDESTCAAGNRPRLKAINVR